VSKYSEHAQFPNFRSLAVFVQLYGGVSPYLPMVQLSQDQFGEYFLKRKFNFENNLRVKQHNFHRRCPVILAKNLVWRPCGADWGDNPPGPPSELPLVGERIASMLLGG